MKRKYKSATDTVSVEIMHGIKDLLHGDPTLLLSIHDLNRELQSLMDSFFRYHGISPKLSLIELTFDFFTDDHVKLFEFLKFYLIQKNARTRPHSGYSTTFYLNDIRNSSVGMRLYRKDLNGHPKKLVRLELVLKRPVIRRLGLEFPLGNIDSLDLSKFFSFKFLDLEYINDYLIWKHRHRIAEAEKTNKRYGSEIVKGTIRGFLHPYKRAESLMEKVDMLKSDKKIIPNYSRFLKPLDGFNSHFLDVASRQSFIQSKHALL